MQGPELAGEVPPGSGLSFVEHRGRCVDAVPIEEPGEDLAPSDAPLVVLDERVLGSDVGDVRRVVVGGSAEHGQICVEQHRRSSVGGSMAGGRFDQTSDGRDPIRLPAEVAEVPGSEQRAVGFVRGGARVVDGVVEQRSDDDGISVDRSHRRHESVHVAQHPHDVLGGVVVPMPLGVAHKQVGDHDLGDRSPSDRALDGVADLRRRPLGGPVVGRGFARRVHDADVIREPIAADERPLPQNAMDRTTAQLFFSLLTMGALVSSFALLALRAAAHRSGAATRAIRQLSPAANGVAATFAVVSMLGSLYFSEVADYLPCTLCWYQRIAMYSLALVLTVAAVRQDRGIRVYAVPLAAIGAGIALYHWLLERFPDLDAGVCSVTVPCEFVWFERFGFVTLPFMALTAFVSIISWLTIPSMPANGEELS